MLVCCVPSVLWCCWLGGRKHIQPVKNWVLGCWHGAMCRLFALLCDPILEHSCPATIRTQHFTDNIQLHDNQVLLLAALPSENSSFLLLLIGIMVLLTSITYAFIALTLLVGRQEGHSACKKTWVVGYWHGYLSGARCRLAYGPADATATHCLLLQ